MRIERFDSLDWLRGVAILGMLVANIPWHTGTSMSRIHDVDGLSVAAWLVQYALVDQRFMPIFCMLFGAGVLLLADGRVNAPGFTRFYLRRMAVLFMIGLAHAYLIWPGDILLTYALSAPVLLLFLRASAPVLLACGLAFKAVDLAFLQWPDLYAQTLRAWLFDGWLVIGDPPMSEAAAYAGSYTDLLSYNVWRNQFIQWTAMPYFRMWNALGFMLIGMALFRWGILQARADARIYRRLIMGGLVFGLPPLVYGLLGRIGGHETVGSFLGWSHSLPLSTLAYMTGTAATSMALLGGLILMFRGHETARWTAPVRAVGRMALSNYIFHSVFFLLIFAGLEWVAYDTLDPDDRLVWVAGIWIIQLVASPLWLKAFGQGPLERAWRALAGRGPRRGEGVAQA